MCFSPPWLAVMKDSSPKSESQGCFCAPWGRCQVEKERTKDGGQGHLPSLVLLPEGVTSLASESSGLETASERGEAKGRSALCKKRLKTSSTKNIMSQERIPKLALLWVIVALALSEYGFSHILTLFDVIFSSLSGS